MAIGLHEAISCFQKKIGTYDKTNWEITVEKQEITQVLTEKLSVAKLPTDLLDLDLIRGSTFTKAKPGYHWTLVTSTGFLKVLFFPFYYRWWLQQTSLGVWLFYVSLYFLQLVALVIYMIHQTDDEFVTKAWPEAVIPLVVMFFLGEMYIHVVSTNFTKPIAHKIKKKKQRSERGDSHKRNLRCRNEMTERVETVTRGRSLERPELEGSSEGRTNDTSVERKSREVSVERIIPSTDDDRLIRDSEPEVDKTIGIRNRYVRTSSDDPAVNTTTATTPNKNNNNNINNKNLEEVSGSNRHKRNVIHNNNANVEETSACEEHSDSSTSSITNDEEKEITDTETADLLFPNYDGVVDVSQNNTLAKMRRSNDLIAVSLWDGTSFKKIKFTFFEIGLSVVKKVEAKADKSSDYLSIAIISSLLIGLLPLFFRIYRFHIVNNKEIEFLDALWQVTLEMRTFSGVSRIFKQMMGSSYKHQLITIIGMISRIVLSFSVFFLLCVAESAYKRRYMYAKYFGALTSTRRARRNRLPHFRLHKVKNIKAWLSLRSFLKKRSPQRSVDTVVSMTSLIDVLLLVIASVQFLSINVKDERDHFLSYFMSWELSVWSLVLGVFLIRFISLGSDINRKYRNMSILLTEQINLYVQMENNTKKKEELLIANNVLKLAAKLLKELDGPFKVNGFIMNPLLSNITRVVVLSLFSGVMSDILGFRLRLWKIKA